MNLAANPCMLGSGTVWITERCREGLSLWVRKRVQLRLL